MRKLNEFATQYGIDMRDLESKNVAFNINDNTDDQEPQQAVNIDHMVDPVVDYHSIENRVTDLKNAV